MFFHLLNYVQIDTFHCYGFVETEEVKLRARRAYKSSATSPLWLTRRRHGFPAPIICNPFRLVCRWSAASQHARRDPCHRLVDHKAIHVRLVRCGLERITRKQKTRATLLQLPYEYRKVWATHEGSKRWEFNWFCLRYAIFMRMTTCTEIFHIHIKYIFNTSYIHLKKKKKK